MSKMPQAISGCIQSVWQWVLPDGDHQRRFRGVHALLLLPDAVGFEQVEWERIEEMRCFKSGT